MRMRLDGFRQSLGHQNDDTSRMLSDFDMNLGARWLWVNRNLIRSWQWQAKSREGSRFRCYKAWWRIKEEAAVAVGEARISIGSLGCGKSYDN